MEPQKPNHGPYGNGEWLIIMCSRKVLSRLATKTGLVWRGAWKMVQGWLRVQAGGAGRKSRQDRDDEAGQ